MDRDRTPMVDSPPLQRFGWPELAYGLAPAAGAHYSQKVDGAYLQRLVSVFVTLTTDANVADRSVVVEYRDANDRRYQVSGAPVSQTASSEDDWAFNVFQPRAEWPVDSGIVIPLMPTLLLPTHSWRVYVSGIQAGDQLSNVRYVFERFYSTDVA